MLYDKIHSMSASDNKKFFESTGIVRNEKELMIDIPLPFTANSKVKVTVSIDDSDEENDQWSQFSLANAMSDIKEEPDLYSEVKPKYFFDDK